MNAKEASALVAACFNTWYSSLVRYAYWMIRDLDSAEDLAQDVFLRLYGELRKGKAIDNPRAWMFCVLRHDIGKERSRLAAEVVDGDLVMQRSEEIAAAGEDPEHDDLSRLLSVLTPREQEVMILRMASLKYREIAEKLGISSSAVNALLARAIQKLRKATTKGNWSLSSHAPGRISETLH